MLVYTVYSTVIMARRLLFKYEPPSAEISKMGLTCRLSATDLRCDSYGIRLTINPVPSESRTSFSGFLIFMCSAWKFPSIMKPRINRILLKWYVGSYEARKSIDIPIFVLSPIFGEVDSGLCAQSAEYSHRSWLLFFTFIIPKTKSLSGNEHSPLSADPKQLPVSVLGPRVSLPSVDTLKFPTGTVFGNSSFVSLLRRLKNWLGVVLHSRLSKWKSSSTRKVNAVLGLRNVAGKSPAIINCMSCSGASEQRHQLTPISWTPDLSTIVIIGFPSLS
jgi:hypothetical protein